MFENDDVTRWKNITLNFLFFFLLDESLSRGNRFFVLRFTSSSTVMALRDKIKIKIISFFFAENSFWIVEFPRSWHTILPKTGNWNETVKSVQIFQSASKNLKFFHIVRKIKLHSSLKSQSILTISERNCEIFKFVNFCRLCFVKSQIFNLKS